MRLLNCFQQGQPGGYSLHEEQFAEPCGLSRNAAWGLGNGKTPVINPYVELVGSRARRFADKNTKPSKGLELTPADIPHLAPFLRDDWHLLCVSFWRDFSPERHLDTTRPLFGAIIDRLAKRDLCRTDALAKMTPAEVDRHIEGIIRWAKANAHKGERQLLWEALEEEVKAGTPWGRLTNVYRLIELKDKRVLPVLLKYLALTESEYDLHSLLYSCRDYDPRAFKEAARQFARHKSIDLRLAAGHILFAGGERDEARKVFADILEKGSPWKLEENAIPRLVDALLKDGSEASKQTARLIFKNKRYTEIHAEWVRVHLVSRCAKARIGDGYLSYLPLLDIKGNKIGNISYSTDTVVGELIAQEIIEHLAPEDPDIVRIKKKFAKAADRIPPLKVWLKAKAKALGATNAIEDPKPTTIEELNKLPVGLKVVHEPNPARATEGKGSERHGKYTWWFKTTVRATGADVKIVEFGAYAWQDGKWVFANVTGKPFSPRDFAQWYSCPDALITEGKAYTDPTNWGSAQRLTTGKARWYYIGVDGKGRRVKGEAVLEQKGELDPKRPKDK